MKYKYITPQSEALEMLLDYCILDDSLIDNYGGDNTDPIDGEW